MSQQGDKQESVIVSLSQSALEKENPASSASVPLDEVGNMIQQLDDKINYIYQSITQKNEEQTKHLAGLIAITNFESTLAERLIQKRYYIDPKAKIIYDDLRGLILRSTVESNEKSNALELLELGEKLHILEIEQMKLQTEQIKMQKEKEEGIDRERNLQKRYDELANKHKQAVDGLKAYSKLAEWHEKRVQDVPAIRKENSHFLIKQSWEDALKEFENRQAKPEVPAVSF